MTIELGVTIAQVLESSMYASKAVEVEWVNLLKLRPYYYTIFDGKRPKLNCQVWTASDTPGSFWEKMRIFGSCQKCSIGGRDEKICSCQIRFLSNRKDRQAAGAVYLKTSLHR